MASTSTIHDIPLRRVASEKQNNDSINLERVNPVPTGIRNDGAGDEREDVVVTPAPQTPAQRRMELVQLAVLCWAMFVAGWNDASLGPLIPRIQEQYHLGYTIVSLIFVFRCIVSVFGMHSGSSNSALEGMSSRNRAYHLTGTETWFWKSRQLLILGSVILAVGNVFQVTAMLPFPVFVMGAFINGIGYAMENAQAIAYVAGLPDDHGLKMGLFQATYGAGALISPLVATQFSEMKHWSFHYLISLGVAFFATALFVWLFRGRTQRDCLEQIGVASGPPEKEGILSGTPKRSPLHEIVASKTVHILALFLFVYVGTEVTIGGWIVSFMITVRGGGSSSGYISAGFFGGLMLGRLLLLPVNKLLGPNRAVYLYGALCIGYATLLFLHMASISILTPLLPHTSLELIIWLVPSFLGSALSVAFVGTLLGPLYPIAMGHAARTFHPALLTGSISWVSGVATAGSAVLPFITGAIAGKAGIRSLEPVVVGMLTGMLVLWAWVVKAR
ncbi:hypothetical protein HMN09_00145600 [Mycena chlorophos]|uniref:Major facilitator superfamily (MFS) profile domain-containing protein n=1 Tax=Mycena chlorophos TaxID=658473 RepID=A0A8H6TN27_MYCCL|nr:hypothetical protein HMN09_00145600 [Mycena chlorophos]